MVAHSRLSLSAVGQAVPVGMTCRRKAANTPASTREDLPTPELPSNVTMPLTGEASRFSAAAVSCSRPKKKSASSSRRDSRPRYGFHARPELLDGGMNRLAAQGRHDFGEMRFSCGVYRLDVVDRRQKWQRGYIVRRQDRHQLELGLHHSAVMRGVIFGELPAAHLGTQQNNEGIGGGDAGGELRLPGRAVAQISVSDEDLAAFKFSFDSSLKGVGNAGVRRVITQENAHKLHRKC